MGIQGLLPFLAKSTRDAHVSEFENEFVAIDAYCWLHKGIYSCGFELATNKPTTQYVTYCMRYIDMLLYHKVKPILVFDGRQLSSKKETEVKRREERKKKFEQGKELLRAGQVSEGRKLLGESVNVSHELALNVMKECRKRKIDCIVAPYEADAQLAFLSLKNIVKCVITEDSDLLAYGCERVLFKMDTTGRGRLIEKSQIHVSLNMTPEEFNDDIFRYMCILSGCDYLPSLPSIGPAFALKFVKMLKGNNIYNALPRLPIYLNKMNVKVTPEYMDGFRVADNTFKHQLVYDPFKRSQVPVRLVENNDEIVGTELEDDLAFQLSIGNIDPETMKKVDNFDPDKFGTGFNILWRTDLLPNAISRRFAVNSIFDEARMNETKKRPRDDLEADSVLSDASDLKKQRSPLSSVFIKHFSPENKTQNVLKSGFIFDPKVSIEKKNVSELADQSKLLNSRYFSREKEKPVKPQTGNVSDKRKNETYEDYLMRLYNEYFPDSENNDKDLQAKKKDCCCGSPKLYTVQGSFCSLCKVCNTCCSCNSSVKVTESQQLSEYINRIEEVKKNRRKSPQHLLLDEIHKNPTEISRDEFTNNEDENKEQEKEKVENVSPSQSLNFNFSKILSRFDSFETANLQIETLEEKNSKVVCDDQEPMRSSSPVFKIQKESRGLNKNFKFGNILDTASTSTSIYFSPFPSERLNESAPEVLPSNILWSGNKKMLLRKDGHNNSVPSKGRKSHLNKSSDIKTLFEYGFKRQQRNEDKK